MFRGPTQLLIVASALLAAGPSAGMAQEASITLGGGFYRSPLPMGVVTELSSGDYLRVDDVGPTEVANLAVAFWGTEDGSWKGRLTVAGTPKHGQRAQWECGSGPICITGPEVRITHFWWSSGAELVHSPPGWRGRSTTHLILGAVLSTHGWEWPSGVGSGAFEYEGGSNQNRSVAAKVGIGTTWRFTWLDAGIEVADYLMYVGRPADGLTHGFTVLLLLSPR